MIKDKNQIIVIAAYRDLVAAREDFNEVELRLKHGLELRAAALVTKGDTGELKVVEAANRHVRTGAAFGAGLGVLLGLVFEPLLLGFLVGGIGGAAVAAVAEHELRSGLRDAVGAALDDGTAAILALAYPNGRAPVEATLGRAASFAELPLDSSTVYGVETAVAAEIAKLRA